MLALATLACVLAPVQGPAQAVPQSIKDALKRADAAVAQIVKVPAGKRTFANTIGALDDISVRLDNDTSLFLFMQNVSTDENVRESSRAAEELVTNWAINLGKREDLYKAVKAYADTKPKLQGEQKRLLDFTMRDYRRSGMMLAPDKRKKLKELEIEINRLGIEFQKNIADDETMVPLSAAELKGMPEDVLKRQKQAMGMYLVGMDGPTFTAALDYVEDEATRQKLWLAYKRRGGKKNVRVLERILKLRAQAASLLGYPTTVDYEVEVRMSKNAGTIADFYEKLKPIVRKKALKDFEEFNAAKQKHTGNPNAKLQPWDYSFYKTLLMKEKYAVDSEKVAEYFPMDAVVNGLFSITESLYGIEYKDVTANAKALNLPIWHPDVKLYEVYDKASKKLLGRMYTDLYPRDNKYNHAACWGLRPRKTWSDGKQQVPLAALVCNFTKPTADKPSLLPHDEVETFFHEFGHGLHHILSDRNYGRFSGTSVARDFVEAPSQMMENWVWSPEVLKTFTKHYKTGEPLPAELLAGMKAARTLGSGIETEHQFYYGLVDQAFHTAKNGEIDTIKTVTDLFSEVELYDKIPETWFHASFGHMVGYHGAYYGYQWSLVFAQDMFQRFEELGILSPAAGKYYREKILARGGSMDEMAMLKDYLGREPKMDAFLRHLGMDPGTEPAPAASGTKAPLP
jgi:thimet oligopeptidase